MSDPSGIKSVMAGIHEQAVRDKNPQIGAFESFQKIMAAFQEDLDDDHELGLYISNVDKPFHVRSVARRGALFIFDGVDSADQKVVAIQHYTQMSLQLVRLKKLRQTAARIGFGPFEPA